MANNRGFFKNLIYYIQYLLIRFFEILFMGLPEKTRFKIGEFFGGFFKNLIYYIQYLLIRFFEILFMGLPEKTRFKIGEFFAVLTFKVVKEVRNITILNLKLAFPEKTNEEIKELGIESVKTMSRAFFVNMWLDKYLENDDNFQLVDEELLNEIIQNGPAVYGAMHFGNMEAPVKLASRKVE